jgi:RNA polymerase sigma factor (sigma-70 family)
VWGQRPRLLRIARRRTNSEQDAEDVVAEALLRAMENPEIGEERLPAWLTTVTVRLCVDLHRDSAREQRLWSRAGMPATSASCEDWVCDRSEAAWVSRRLTSLPSRQAEALRLRADGQDVDGVAQSLGVSYRTAESLLARGRAAARTWLVFCLAALAALVVRFGRVIRISGAAKAAAASAGVAAVGVTVATQTWPHHAAIQPRPPAVTRQAPRPAPGVPANAEHHSTPARSRHPASPAPASSGTASTGVPATSAPSVTPAVPGTGISQPQVGAPKPGVPVLPSIQTPQLLPGLPAVKLPAVNLP